MILALNTSLRFVSSQNAAPITHKFLSSSLLLGPLVLWSFGLSMSPLFLSYQDVCRDTPPPPPPRSVSITIFWAPFPTTGTVLMCVSSSQSSSEYTVGKRPDLGACKLLLINASSMQIMAKTIVFDRNKWTNAYAYAGAILWKLCCWAMPSWYELLDLTRSKMAEELLHNTTYGAIILYELVIVWNDYIYRYIHLYVYYLLGTPGWMITIEKNY